MSFVCVDLNMIDFGVIPQEDVSFPTDPGRAVERSAPDRFMVSMIGLSTFNGFWRPFVFG